MTGTVMITALLYTAVERVARPSRGKTKPKVSEESSGNLSPPESERRPPRSALWINTMRRLPLYQKRELEPYATDGEPRAKARRSIQSRLQSFLCFITLDMLRSVQERHVTRSRWIGSWISRN
ncbi:hypothetical protein MHYP_G00017500 [Metynnis hypsauchen]